MTKIFLNISVAAGFAAIVTACASAPEFRPSRSLDRAESLQESLVLCGEYRVDPSARRAIALRPFLDCVHESAGRHPLPRTAGLDAFLAEFRDRYDTLREIEWTPSLGAAIDTAVHAVLRVLWTEPGRPARFTAEERQEVLHHFPRTARVLGAENWKVSRTVTIDPRLELLVAGVAGLVEGPREGSAPESRDAEDPKAMARACSRLTALKESVAILRALREDRDALTSLAPENPGAAKADERYRQGLDTAETELLRLRLELRELRARGRFRAGGCA